jgi:CheY-like chemotaxis protein
VIVLSSAGGRDAARGRETVNVVQFLVKPARRAQLFDAIATTLGQAPVRPDSIAASPGSAVPAKPGKRILVVDDNAVNQRLATLLLEKSGYGVDAVADGAQAIEAVTRHPYDGVLMDCEMPVMDGYAAAAEIRRREAGTWRIPIIAVTASAMKGDAERAIAAGMDAHVTKPIDISELNRTLTHLLDTAGPAATRPTPQNRATARLRPAGHR